MTVLRLYKNAAFEPEAITIMTGALDDVCRTLGLSEHNDPDVSKVAKTVIEFAQRGVRDPGLLRDSVLQALRA
jgi:hypothetical protein